MPTGRQALSESTTGHVLSKRAFDKFRAHMADATGVVLTEQRADLTLQRLVTLADAHSLSIESMADRIDRDEALKAVVIEAMTNNETSFFRDGHPFETLQRHVFAQWIAENTRKRPLKLWCAATSTGQEAYSLAIALNECREPPVANWHLVATDIDRKSLDKASKGQYSDFEVGRGLSDERRQRWFEQRGKMWQARRELRDQIRFVHHNLLHPYAPPNSMDVVLLRNVLMYLDSTSRHQVLVHCARSLRVGGVLLIGAVESLEPHPLGLQRMVRDKTVLYAKTETK